MTRTVSEMFQTCLYARSWTCYRQLTCSTATTVSEMSQTCLCTRWWTCYTQLTCSTASMRAVLPFTCTWASAPRESKWTMMSSEPKTSSTRATLASCSVSVAGSKASNQRKKNQQKKTKHLLYSSQVDVDQSGINYPALKKIHSLPLAVV